MDDSVATNSAAAEFIPYSIYLMESAEYWYVGSAWNKTTPRTRYTRHLSGKGGARKLWDAIQMGVEFTLTLLECGLGKSKSDAYCAEERWIEKYLADDPRETLNANFHPSQRHGWVESEESLTRRSEKARGRPNPKNSERLKGSKRPELTAILNQPGARERRSVSVKAGMAKMTPEAKATMVARRKATIGPPPTHCPQGHEYTEENTYIHPSDGTRNCRICRREQNRIRRASGKTG